MKHRKEEDDLYRKFAHHREEEDRRIREEFRVITSLYTSLLSYSTFNLSTFFSHFLCFFYIRAKDEWEKELEQLSEKWERERGKARTQQFQQEKEDLEKNMTLRRDKKKESLTRKMLEHERYICTRAYRDALCILSCSFYLSAQ